MDIKELKDIFEYELKRKLAQRSRSPIEELRKLISALKFYDFSNTMLLTKDEWIRGVLRTGLCGFNITDLANVFDQYDPNKTGNINYLNFARYLYGKEKLSPVKGNTPINPNQNVNNNNNYDLEKGKFVPPGFYDRDIDKKELKENIDIYETNLNNNNNKNINDNNNINDSMGPKKMNYHMSKIQSEIVPTNIDNIIIQKEEQKQNNINQNIVQNNNNIEENKNYFKELLEILRTKINTNNGITYYSLAHHLKSNENKTTHTTNLESLISKLKLLQIDLNQDDVINFFACLDYTQSGQVSTDEILRVIAGEIPERRKIEVITKFGEMDKDRTGYLPIKFLKNIYNAKFHPDCFLGKKPENEVLDEFMFTFEVFCFIKGLSDEQNISYKDFVEYYTPISASIKSDNYFDDILLGAWSIEEDKKIPNERNEINENNNINKVNSPPNNIVDTRKNIQNNDIRVEQRNNFQINQNPNLKLQSPKLNPNSNYSQEKKLGKIHYNPITNEFTTESNYQNRNFNYNRNNEYISNIRNMNINSMNISEVPSISKLKTLLSMRGLKSIFIIQRMLYIYDKNQTGEIPFNKLCEIFEIYNLGLSREEIFEFFEIIDKEHKGFIKYNDLILILINDIKKDRRIIIQNLFDKLRKGKDYVLLNDIKKYFNPNNHPDFIEKIRNRDEIAFDYFDSLEIFREYNMNLRNKNIINGIVTYLDFENYFKEISLSINDDKLFEYIINYCWEVGDEINNYGNQNGYGNDNVRLRAGQEIINNQNK